MLIGNEKQVRRGATATKPTLETTPIDNDVLSTVQQEYLLMEQEHARIRAEALAAYDPERHNPLKPINNPELV